MFKIRSGCISVGISVSHTALVNPIQTGLLRAERGRGGHMVSPTYLIIVKWF